MKKGHIVTILILSSIILAVLGYFIYLKYSSFKRKLVRVALAEASKWKNIKELSTKASTILLNYWESVGRNFSESQMQDESVQQNNPWSSAFISYLFKKSGAKEKFPYSSAHSGYFQYAKSKRNDKNASLRGFRISEYKPKVGDIVVYSRESGKGYDSTGHFPSHGEVVIEKTNISIKAIGGNVSNTVKISTYSLDENGFLTQKEQSFFMVIQNNIK